MLYLIGYLLIALATYLWLYWADDEEIRLENHWTYVTFYIAICWPFYFPMTILLICKYGTHWKCLDLS